MIFGIDIDIEKLASLNDYDFLFSCIQLFIDNKIEYSLLKSLLEFRNIYLPKYLDSWSDEDLKRALSYKGSTLTYNNLDNSFSREDNNYFSFIIFDILKDKARKTKKWTDYLIRYISELNGDFNYFFYSLPYVRMENISSIKIKNALSKIRYLDKKQPKTLYEIVCLVFGNTTHTFEKEKRFLIDAFKQSTFFNIDSEKYKNYYFYFLMEALLFNLNDKKLINTIKISFGIIPKGAFLENQYYNDGLTSFIKIKHSFLKSPKNKSLIKMIKEYLNKNPDF